MLDHKEVHMEVGYGTAVTDHEALATMLISGMNRMLLTAASCTPICCPVEPPCPKDHMFTWTPRHHEKVGLRSARKTIQYWYHYSSTEEEKGQQKVSKTETGRYGENAGGGSGVRGGSVTVAINHTRKPAKSKSSTAAAVRPKEGFYRGL